MSTKEHIQDIGQVGLLYLGGVRVEVKIVDYKHSWGRDRWQVTPTKGSGTVWTETKPE